jgi:D-alanyl-D-alanine carboxypeptidase/D-alanyl-D-alanine-endopeptidase (penicillin-binding protein 4)
VSARVGGLKVMLMQKIKYFRFIVFAGFVSVFLFQHNSQLYASSRDWQDVAQMIGPNDAVAVFDPDGGLVFAKNADKKLIPASTLKLLTALCALEHLGEKYRFITEFYLSNEDDLIIKGYADPLLVSEEVEAIAGNIAKRVKSVRHIVTDDTWFDSSIDIPGTRAGSLQPYDAPVGALCVNFNTVHVKLENNVWKSAEPQTPLLPVARKRLKKIGADSGRFLLSSHNRENLKYAGQLFAHFLNRNNVQISGEIKHGQALPEIHRLIYRHQSSFSLAEVVSGLMAYSNNFTANQILLATGAEVFGPPATLEKALKVLRSYANQKLGIYPELAEGSGISRKNRFSAKMFGPVLDAFAPYHHLMCEENGIFYKTGTLGGIQARAGFIKYNSRLYGFAVLLNTPGRQAEPVVAAIASKIRN